MRDFMVVEAGEVRRSGGEDGKIGVEDEGGVCA